MQFALSNDLSELNQLAQKLEAFGQQESLTAEIVQQLNLALDELVTNTINYGYAEEGTGTIEVKIERNGSSIEVTLADTGRPFNPFSADEPDTDADIDDRPIGGLGVFLVRSIIDDCRYAHEAGRNVVRLRKKI